MSLTWSTRLAHHSSRDAPHESQGTSRGRCGPVSGGTCSGQSSGSQLLSQRLCSIHYTWGQGNSSANPAEKQVQL